MSMLGGQKGCYLWRWHEISLRKINKQYYALFLLFFIISIYDSDGRMGFVGDGRRVKNNKNRD